MSDSAKVDARTDAPDGAAGRLSGAPAKRPGQQQQSEPGRDGSGPPEQPVVVGLLAAPGLVYDLARDLSRDLPRLLGRRFPEVNWQVVLRPEPAAAASESDVDLVDVARQRMLAEGWKLAVCLTDFPVLLGRRPVTAYVSASAGVGLVSVPALGAVNLDDRLREAVLRTIEGLLGESVDRVEEASNGDRVARMRTRLHDLSSPAVGTAEMRDDRSIFFLAAVGFGKLRLVLGMVRANRPHRLVIGLSRAIVAALGLDIFGVASPGVWMIADGLSWWRLGIAGLASILVTCVSLIAAHGLWERSWSERLELRERVVLFNLVTTITVVLGVVTLFLTMFAINVAVGLALISDRVLQKQLGHPADLGTYLVLAWLVAALATLGGALGAALENHEAVREAAYGYRPDARTEAMQQRVEAASA